MRYPIAVFDMDGTILYTLDDLTDALNIGLTACGYPTRTVAEVRTFVGNGKRRLIELAVPAGTSEGHIDRVEAAFTEYYTVHCVDKTRPYEGVNDLLRRLREAGVKTAVVSNKSDPEVQELVSQYFPGLFDVAVGEKPGVPKKPAPDQVDAALAALSASKSDAVYIGDSEVDYQTAVNAALPCISVTWGFRDRDLLLSVGATTFADTPEEVEHLVLGN